MSVSKKNNRSPIASAALFCCLLLTCCNYSHHRSSAYPGYTLFDSVTFYKYCDMGSVKMPVLDREKLTVMETTVNFCKMNDSVFWTPPLTYPGYPFYYYFSYNELLNGSTFEKQLLHARKGDSITYIIPADSLFARFFHLPLPLFLHNGNKIKIHIRVADIMDSMHYREALRTINQYRKDMEIQEQLKLLHYVTSNNIPDSARKNGIYILPLTMGAGPIIKEGSDLSIAYTGYFTDGRLFDSVSPQTPLQFRYGDKGQIVEGLENAIKMMRQGEIAKIIIPSQLAFGEKGSLTGIVPPYTTLIYKVTIIEVKN